MSTYSETFTETLREVDLFLNESIVKRHLDSFRLPLALLYGVDYMHGEVPFIAPIDGQVDIYDMLSDIESAIKLYQQGFQSFAIVTCGWAAPIGDGDAVDDIRPSEHDDRRRVRVMVLCHKGQLGSSLRFTDDEAVTYDEGNALGSLADAVEGLHELTSILFKANTHQTERQLP